MINQVEQMVLSQGGSGLGLGHDGSRQAADVSPWRVERGWGALISQTQFRQTRPKKNENKQKK